MYDGASDMTGKKSGVAQQIKYKPKAHYTHSHGRSVSLSVKYVREQGKMLGETISAAEEMAVLMKYSPKLKKILGCIKEQGEFDGEHETEMRGDVAKLSQLRWRPFVLAVYKGFLIITIH